jgi:hypothetical protein
MNTEKADRAQEQKLYHGFARMVTDKAEAGAFDADEHGKGGSSQELKFHYGSTRALMDHAMREGFARDRAFNP